MTDQNLQGIDITGVPSKWSRIYPLEGEIVQTLESIKSTVDPVFTALTTIAEIVKGVLNVTVNLLIDFTDPNKLAVQAAIEVVRTMLDDLVGEAGCYFMAVPIIPIDKELSDVILYPKSPGESLVETTAVLDVAIKEGRVGSGGNYGFLNTVAASLSDPDDPFKPTFGEDAHIAGIVIYIGAESYLKTASLVNRLVTLFSGPNSNSSGMSEAIKGVSDFPKPKVLKAEIAPSTKTSAMLENMKNRHYGIDATAYAVKLTWDRENEMHVLPWPDSKGTGNETWKIKNVRVYRDTKPIPTVISWRKLARLIIAEYAFDGWVSEFFDEDIELGKTHYYAIGYEMVEVLVTSTGEVSELSTDEPQPFNISTTQITLPKNIDIFSRKGTPPDWSVIPSPLALIPSITNIVRRIHAVLDDIEKRLNDKYAKMRKYINDLSALINKHIDWVQEIVDTVEAIVDSLNWSGVYAGATGFAGKGGNSFMLNALGEALNDESDPNRPPFDNGTEAVCGFIMYSGSSTVGGLQKFIDQIEFLFGVNLRDTGKDAGQDYESAWNKAVATIDVAIDSVQGQICLSDNIRDMVDCPEDPELVTRFDASLEPAGEDEDTSCSEA